MTAGSEVVEDYRSIHLSLRAHPVSFLRQVLTQRKIISCGELATIRDGRRVRVAGLVLLRQKPGSAKGVMFMTLEDETGVANLVIWARLFEAQRRLILSASMVSVVGKVQREGSVIHVVAESLTDEAELLQSVGRDRALRFELGRGDGAKNGGGPDHRDGPRVRDIYTPESPAIRVATRDFR
ncbi:MAG: OB-fold nucleic acid binding domain-containing protein [Janthinobacterium lividum]